MKLYRCYLFGEKAAKPDCTPIYGDTDKAARERAMQLLRDRPHVDRIEAWRECDFAFRVNRHAVKAEGGA